MKKELEKLNKDVKICGIYKITSPNNRVYIGQSNDIRRRILTYFEPKGGSSQVRLKASFNKHGIDLHNLIILEECEESLLNERERYWQEHYNVLSKSGLNCKMTTTLDKSGTLSNETKKLIGSKTKGTTKTCQSTMKKVYQYSKDGTFLQDYISLREAERQTGIHSSSIRHSIKGRGFSKSAGGYLWSYDKLKSHFGYVGQIGKPIQQCSLDNKLIQEFDSICTASKQLNISKSGIIRCCKGKQKQCGGFTFKYITNENI
jgi:hypothetical protein